MLRWRERPEDMVREEFGVEPEPDQLQVLRAFPSQDPKDLHIALQGCTGNGKSAVMSWCGFNFLTCYAELGQHPKGVAISVTEDNLMQFLWAEFAHWQQRSRYFSAAFTLTREKLYCNDHPNTWFIAFRSFPKDATPETKGRTLSGLHAQFVLILVDESATIPVQVGRAGEQARSGGVRWFKFIQGFNPISRDGMGYEAATKMAHRWKLIRSTGDPDDPNRTSRMDIEFAREQIADHGRDDPWVMAYVLSKFPNVAINTLLTPEEVDAAMARRPQRHSFEWAPRILGVDVATTGLHRSVICPRQGPIVFKMKILRGVEPVDGAGHVARTQRDWGARAVFIDDTGGFGGQWMEHLKLLGLKPIGVHFAGAPYDPRFLNKRSEMWFAAATHIKAELALPLDGDLKRSLTTVTYAHQGDRLKLEDKRLLIKRLGFSPDDADALALTYAQPVAAEALVRRAFGARKATPPPYSPFDWMKRRR